MVDPFRELEHLSQLATAHPSKRFSRLYRLVRHVGILAAAAERVRQNTGGRTAGIDGQTRRQINAELLTELADDLTHGRYRAKAVRRAYIPKGTTGRRALGIPTIRDRIVQAAVAQVLEAITNRSFGPVPLASDQDEARSSAFARWLRRIKLEQRGSLKATWSRVSTPFRTE